MSDKVSAWSPLRIPVYRSFLVSAVVANIGIWMQDVSAAWLMTGLAPSPLFVSLLQTAASLPVFLLALPSGALADILDRRRLLLGTFAGLIAAAATLGILTLLGWMSAWLLLAFVFLMGVGNALARPALDALTPEIVPSRDLSQAVALDAVGFNIARAAGGAISGFLTAVLGSGPVFLLNAGSNLPYAFSLLRWKRAPSASTLPTESVGGAVRAGLRYVRHAPVVRSVLIRVAFFIIPGTALWSLLPLLARQEMKLGSGEFGLLVAVFGAGALLAALVLPAARSRIGPNAIVIAATLLLAGVLLGLANVRAFVAVTLAMAVAGAAWLTLMSTVNAALQGSIPSWVRARASALYELTFMGGVAAGSTLWGLIATVRDIQSAFIAAAIVGVVGLLIGLRYRLPEKKVDGAPSLHWPAPSLSGAQDGAESPVEVTVEYRVDPAKADAFKEAMESLRVIRRRDGAIDWSLEVDPGDPSHQIETFRVESWTEHLRQHERVTVADREVEESVRKFHIGRTPPVVTHRAPV